MKEMDFDWLSEMVNVDIDIACLFKSNLKSR